MRRLLGARRLPGARSAPATPGIAGGAILLASVLATTACVNPAPRPVAYTGQDPKSDLALRTAARDLGCPLEELQIIASANHRYVNEAAFRWVIEGCGERAGYFEICELLADPIPPGWTAVDGSLACRDLLMTRVHLAPAPAPDATGAAPPPGGGTADGPDGVSPPAD
ncbi:MAG: hypothetical protein KF894_09500 [Labilithrix sp.]|nr:hypothetical protein [Labilithrix sp.]